MSLLRRKSKSNTQEDVEPLLTVPKACSLCDLGSGNACTPSGPSDLANVKLIIIGDRPGATEAKTGIHFTGQLSSIARKLVSKQLGLSTRIPDGRGRVDNSVVEEVLYMNAVLCKPGKDVKTKPVHYKTCSSYINSFISQTDPSVPILLCGGPAIEHYLPLTQSDGKPHTVKSARGLIHEAGGRKYVCTFNPAVVTRGLSFDADAANKSAKQPEVIFDSMLYHFIRDLGFVKTLLGN